jgi:hypothetical protein
VETLPCRLEVDDLTARTWRISETDYPAIRRVMGPERAEIDDADLEGLLGELFPGAAPEDVEDFMGTLQRATRSVAPMAQRALPGMMQGAVQGATVAGPWGALAGALGGGAMSLMGGPTGGPGRVAPPQALAAPALGGPVVAPVAPAPFSVPGGGSAGPSNAAVTQLLALLSRPETMQALLALAMSTSGRPAIASGPSTQSPAAFANAISELAAEAALQGAGEPACGHGRELCECTDCSQASPREQAAWLVMQLDEFDRARAIGRGDAFLEWDAEDSDVGDNEEEEDMETLDDWMGAYEAALEGKRGE